MMRSPGRAPLWAAVLVASLCGAAAADVLVLRRDWTPTDCLTSSCSPDYPDSFSVAQLALASDASPAAQAGCDGKGGLRKADMEAAGLSRDQLACAWQNHSAALDSLQNSWKAAWQDYGKCTPADSAVAYLRLGMQLDSQFPLPQNLPASLDGGDLAAAVAAAFGGEPYVGCSNGALTSVSLCFDPSGVGSPSGPAVVDCPWAPDAACTGELAVPRGGQGTGECASYYTLSPVSLLSLGGTPVAAPAAAPAAAPTPAPLAAPTPSPAQQPADSAPTPAPTAAEELAPGPAPETGTLPAPVPASASDDAAPAPAPATDTAGGASTSGSGEGEAGQGSQPAGGVPPDSSGASTDASTQGADGSSTSSSDSGGGTSSSSMAIALGAGAAAGIVLGVAAFGGGYVIWNRRRRAAQSVAQGGDAEKGLGGAQVSPSGGSLSSWSSSSGGKGKGSGASSAGGSSGARPPRPPRSERSASGSVAAGGGAAALLQARLDSGSSLPRRQDSVGSGGRSAASSGKLYRQVSGASLAAAQSSPSRSYRQPSGPPRPDAPPPGASRQLFRQDSSSSGGSGTVGSGRLYRQASGPMAAAAAAARSPSKQRAPDPSAGGGSRSPGRLYRQQSGARSGSGSFGRDALAEAAGGATDNPLWAGGGAPEGQPWMDNPLAAPEGEAPPRPLSRSKSSSERSLSSHRLPAVSE